MTTAVLLLCNEKGNAQSIIPSLGDSRSGTSGFQFLKINVDARSAGMGGSNAADAMDGSALFWNPALASQVEQSQVTLGHTAYFADISLNNLAYIHKMGRIALGGSLVYLDSGEMIETNEFNPFGTGRTFRTIHMAAGLTFSQELTSLFSYGVSLKYLDERIEEIQSRTAVVDVGFFYRVGETGLRFAIGLNNFWPVDATPTGETERQTLEGRVTEDEFESISPPATFIIGTAYDLLQTNDIRIVITGQITNPSDNAERLNFGTEFQYLDMFFVRTGYEHGMDEVQMPNFGAGFKVPFGQRSINLDYGFSTRERLGSMHRLTFKFNL